MTTAETGTGTETVTESIGRQAGRGLKWSLAGTMVLKMGNFGMGLVLARILSPSDFGIYAIALAATAVLMNINDVGLIAATVQWRGSLKEMAPTATTLASAFGVLMYAVFYIAAPTFAGASGSRAAAPVVQLLTLVIVVDGFTAVRSGALMRGFHQDRLILANFVGLASNACTAIPLALHGAGAYSFAWGQVVGTTATGILVMIFARVPLRVGFDKRIAGRLMRFGVPLAASLGVDAIVTNVQFMIIGRLTGETSLGYFLLAFNISSWAQTVLGTAIRYVSVAGFSRLSEHDDEALSVGVQRSVPLLVTVVAPIVTLSSVLAAPLVALLYGHAWAPAVPVLRILVLLTLARMIVALATDALMGAGATRTTFWLNIGWAAVLIPLLWVATAAEGLRGAALAQTASGYLVAVPLTAFALYRNRVNLRPVPGALVRPLAATALAAGTAFAIARLIGHTPPVLQLVVAGTVALAVYVPAAIPREQLRQWAGALARRRQPAEATT